MDEDRIPLKKKRRIAVWVLIVLVLIWLVNQIVKLPTQGKTPLYDFVEYWTACRTFLSGGNAYDPAQLLNAQRRLGWDEKDPLMMWNPPWTLPLLIPITFLDYWPSRGVWLLISIFLVCATCDWFWRIYGGSSSRRWISWWAGLFFLPSAIAIFMGQLTPLVLSGLAGFLWALRKRRFVLAGAFTLLIAVKPHLLIPFWFFLALWILKQRHWKILIGGLSSFTCACLAAVLVNPHIFNQYLGSLLSKSGPQIWLAPTWGVGIRMLYPDIGYWVHYLPSLAGSILALWLCYSWTYTPDWTRKLPTILLLSITTSSFTWIFDWVILLPAVVSLLCRIENHPAKARRIFVFCLLAMQPMLAFSYILTHNNFYTVWFPPTLWFLFWRSTRLTNSLDITSNAH